MSDPLEENPFDISGKTDEQIIREANELARKFYQAHGYVVPDGYKFYDATHPQEIGMWNLAVIAYEFLTGTDLTDVLCGIEE